MAARGPAGGTPVRCRGGCGYLALAEYARWLNDPAQVVAGFWPAAGVATAALLLSPARRWAWVIGAVVAADLASTLLHGDLLDTGLWRAGANGLAPLVGAVLVRRYVDPQGALVSLGRVVGFVLYGVVAGALAVAAVESVGSLVTGRTAMWEAWATSGIGHTLGVLVIAPVLLTWRDGHPPRRRA